MNYGIGNVKAKVSGGDANLNIAYGLTPPNDTTKLWVRTDKTPTSVEITTEPTWSDEIETTALYSSLEDISEAILCRAGEYVYIIGGIENGLSRNVISRYNTITGDYEDVATLPYALNGARAIAYKDYIYIFWGNTITIDSTTYWQNRMIKFNWKTNKIYTGNFSYLTASYVFSRNFDIFRVGKLIYFFYGVHPYSYNPKPDSNNICYDTSTNQSANFGRPVAYDIEKDEFVDSSNELTENRESSFTQKIDKTGVSFGGVWGNFAKTIYNGIMAKGKSLSGTYPFKTQIVPNNNYAYYGYKNVVLTTNDKLFICGGRTLNNYTFANLVNSTSIYSLDYATKTFTLTNYTMPTNVDMSSVQYNEQTSYGRGSTYFVEVKNPIELEENKMLIIPDVDNDDEITIGTMNGAEFKASIQSIYIGNSNGKAEEVRLYQYDGTKWVGLNCDDYIPSAKENLILACQWGQIVSTSCKMGIVCNVGDLIVASVIARNSGNETASEGWTLIGRSQIGNYSQTLAFYKKVATSQYEEITITQSPNERIYISLVSFVGNVDATLGDFSLDNNKNYGNITLPSNKICLVSASSALWPNSTPYGDWSYEDENNQLVDAINVSFGINIQRRLGTWIDDKGGARVIKANPLTESSGNTIILGYVVIEQPSQLSY